MAFLIADAGLAVGAEMVAVLVCGDVTVVALGAVLDSFVFPSSTIHSVEQ